MDSEGFVLNRYYKTHKKVVLQGTGKGKDTRETDCSLILMTMTTRVIDSGLPCLLYVFIFFTVREALGNSGQVLINTLWIREQLAFGREGSQGGDTAVGARAVYLEVEIRLCETKRTRSLIKRAVGEEENWRNRFYPRQDRREVRVGTLKCGERLPSSGQLKASFEALD